MKDTFEDTKGGNQKPQIEEGNTILRSFDLYTR
jgi:hypothetical protein